MLSSYFSKNIDVNAKDMHAWKDSKIELIYNLGVVKLHLQVALIALKDFEYIWCATKSAPQPTQSTQVAPFLKMAAAMADLR